MFIKFNVLKHKRYGGNPDMHDNFNLQNYTEMPAYIRRDTITEIREDLIGEEGRKVCIVRVETSGNTYSLHMKMDAFVDRYGNDVFYATPPKNFSKGVTNS